MELQKKLAKIQKELKAPKNQFNKFGGYKYRSCEDILDAVKPLLDDCILTLSHEIWQIGERYYVRAQACISLGEESIPVHAFAREQESRKGMDESQVTGSASSYARKYALNGLFLIDDAKDADSTNKHEKGGDADEGRMDGHTEASKPEVTPPPPKSQQGEGATPWSQPQAKKFYAMCKSKTFSDNDISEFKTWVFAKVDNMEAKNKDGDIKTIPTKKGASKLFDDFDKLSGDFIEYKSNAALDDMAAGEEAS